MIVSWSRHAKLRFAERAAMLGINYGDIEFEIKRQKIRIKEAENKFKTIFQVGKNIFSAVKIDGKNFIHVLTLWEANEKEVELWKKK